MSMKGRGSFSELDPKISFGPRASHPLEQIATSINCIPHHVFTQGSGLSGTLLDYQKVEVGGIEPSAKSRKLLKNKQLKKTQLYLKENVHGRYQS